MPTATIFSTAICPYCVAAKNFLRSKGYDYEEVRIDLDPARRDEMVARTRRSSVPQIFFGELHIGGYDDLVAAERSGELKRMLSESGRND